jgi:guanine deaminase
VLGHISETTAEVEAVRRVCGTSSYAEVYDRAGLLSPRSILAHGVHLEDRELERLAFSQTWIAHAPTSNEALGSGTMPLSRVRAAGVRWCLASDVGAGPDLCLLDVIASHLRVHAGRAGTSAVEAFWHATYAGADALGFSSERGALVPGRRADFVVVERVPERLRSAESVLRALLERGGTGRWGEVIAELWIDGRRRHPSSSTRR